MVCLLILPTWLLGSARSWLHYVLFVLEGHVVDTVMCCLRIIRIPSGYFVLEKFGAFTAVT